MQNQSIIRPLYKGAPKIIGLYGLPGSGKSYLKSKLEQELENSHFEFFEGADIIAQVTEGGLEKFRSLSEQEKIIHREKAILQIKYNCAQSSKIGIVTGHSMFWPQGSERPSPVLTTADWRTYTHIVYLNRPPDLIAQQIRKDVARDRGEECSVWHLDRWQRAEREQLRSLCVQHGVLFSIVSSGQKEIYSRTRELVFDFSHHDEETNASRALQTLRISIADSYSKVRVMLVIDGDKTLAADDTGKLFWNEVVKDESLDRDFLDIYQHNDPSNIFKSHLGYSYTAFRQAMLVYELIGPRPVFESLCERITDKVTIRDEFRLLLDRITREEHVGAVVVTCGLACIWKLVLKKAKFEDIGVIGGGRLADGFVVTPHVKAAVVTRLQRTYHMEVLGFGDSQLDLDMLRRADRAFVVVGSGDSRSRSMEQELLTAIDSHNLQAEQVLLPDTVVPRLDLAKLPAFALCNLELRHPLAWRIDLAHATERTSAKLFMSSSRNADIYGPALRRIHTRIGYYLAIEFVADEVGLESCLIRHVSGGHSEGHRLVDENKTLIVPLMRGGEPMAFGISKAFPLASFLHSKGPSDIEEYHLQGMSTVILVDSVINTGASIVTSINHIRSLGMPLRIVVVADVVQVEAVGENGLRKLLRGYGRVTIVALRLSGNKYKGIGGTDTGHRLFNTTHLD